MSSYPPRHPWIPAKVFSFHALLRRLFAIRLEVLRHRPNFSHNHWTKFGPDATRAAAGNAALEHVLMRVSRLCGCWARREAKAVLRLQAAVLQDEFEGNNVGLRGQQSGPLPVPQLQFSRVARVT